MPAAVDRTEHWPLFHKGDVPHELHCTTWSLACVKFSCTPETLLTWAPMPSPKSLRCLSCAVLLHRLSLQGPYCFTYSLLLYCCTACRCWCLRPRHQGPPARCRSWGCTPWGEFWGALFLLPRCIGVMVGLFLVVGLLLVVVARGRVRL